jgi:hypothetical protein
MSTKQDLDTSKEDTGVPYPIRNRNITLSKHINEFNHGTSTMPRS